MRRIRDLIAELKRRHVFKVVAAYAVVAFVLLQLGEIVFPALGLPDWSLTLLVVLIVFGFFPAIILAWAFDLTPEGVVRTDAAEAVGGSPSSEEAPVATLVAASEPGPSAPEPEIRELDPQAIAVLPFTNMSPDLENEYFSDGVAEDLIARLYEIDALRVISRASAWQFKAARTGAREIAARLGVAYLVDGSVRRSGSRVRIGAQLIDARSDRHVWSETYDRELEDIFAIQSDVAGRIATALHATLSEAGSRASSEAVTADVEAYDLYLRGRHLWNRRTARDLAASVERYAAAIERDPEFATARAALAEAYVTLAIYGLRPSAEVLGMAREAAEAALAADPHQPSALTALACVRAIHDWDWAGAADAFERAIDESPQNPTAHQWFATNGLIPLGRFDQALAQLGRAREVDPISPSVEASFGVVDFMRGDFAAALSRFERLVAADPGLAFAQYYRGLSAQYVGETGTAVESLERAREAGGWSAEIMAALGGALAAAGRVDEAERVLAELSAGDRPGYVSPFRIAQLQAGLGRADAALDALELATEERAADLIWVDRFPAFANVRQDPRYREIRDLVFGTSREPQGET